MVLKQRNLMMNKLSEKPEGLGLVSSKQLDDEILRIIWKEAFHQVIWKWYSPAKLKKICKGADSDITERIEKAVQDSHQAQREHMAGVLEFYKR